MNQRRLELLERLNVLQTILDIHVKNKARLWANEKEFEAYINAILDEINEAKAELKALGFEN
jgi:hypothetical protein